MYKKKKGGGVYSYFDFGFIWSFIGVCHFGPLFLSLSVRLHNATKKGTFVLKGKKKHNIKYSAIHILLINMNLP